jgi:hypothetical protein
MMDVPHVICRSLDGSSRHGIFGLAVVDKIHTPGVNNKGTLSMISSRLTHGSAIRLIEFKFLIHM